MDLQKSIELTSYLHKHTFKAYEWGHNDCNTFIAGLHDILYGTDTLSRIAGKYSDRKTAMQFAKNYVNSSQWLSMNGYKLVETTVRKPRWGDIFEVKHGNLYGSGYMYLNDTWYAVEEPKGMVMVERSALLNSRHPQRVWRHD